MPYGRRWFNQGMGRGMGNPYPFCRNFPWLPRRWWASPYIGQYTATSPRKMGYGYPNYSAGFMPFYGHPWGRMGPPR